MRKVKLNPEKHIDDPSIEFAVFEVGERYFLSAKVSKERFEQLLLSGAATEDVEDDGHTEAVMTEDGWSG
ncbi:hypothetical protein TRICHSKD4_5198 [Roseibium sp. TrichSKD4]|uniref:hypothetical protein n=1 Tax=Roseibium sp. TrichSKD4 TaxID=744980 RepID=UPI0001E57554|nr:hypothetical protein [Roseibium sp. TrichSKD4]EFO29372.1 hypothetical protein TRICHSKD4_5198 [Roseibium sp. TrichSKD4]